MNDRPTLLYVALDNWFSSTRLPKFLRGAGFRVVALCTPGSGLAQSRHFDDKIAVSRSGFHEELEDAHARHRPVFIVPADDEAMQALHRLMRTDGPAAPISAALKQTITRSLGDPACYGDSVSKRAINATAARLGIAVPRQEVTETPEQALAFARKVGYPIVLKKENTYGGFGVRRCRDDRELFVSWYWLQAGARSGRIAARMSGRLARQIRPLWRRFFARPGVPLIAQALVPGRVAFRTFVADSGRVLCGMSAVAEAVDPPPFGASSVVRIISHEAMTQATATLTEAVGLSGFGGIDFIIDSATGQAYLLELNPRVTPICHLGGRLGADLCAALFAAATGGAPPAAAPPVETLVALFPNELRRDPASPWLQSAYHDIPFDDPDVLAAWLATLPRATADAVRSRITT